MHPRSPASFPLPAAFLNTCSRRIRTICYKHRSIGRVHYRLK
jgi:hypothetical protein